MAHLLGASTSSKKRRAGEEGDVSEAAAAAAGEEDRISALPDELRRSILTRLTFKDAIRTGALARGWRDLWKTRWPHRASVEVRISSPDDSRRELDALAHEPRPRRRLDRFSLVIDNCMLKSPELWGFTDYAAECRVEDLHVEYLHKEARRSTLKGKFNFPRCSPLLARLSLSRIGVIGSMYYKGARPFRFRALEVIRLHSVDITREGFKNLMAQCPSLLTLDLRGCDCGSLFFQLPYESKRDSLVMPPKLRNVTVADCRGFAVVPVPSLRSFCFRGDFTMPPMSSLSLPEDATLADLYIQFAHSAAELYKTKMLKMKAANLDDLYLFFKTFQCPNLERLFVQLPASSYKHMVGGSTDEVKEDLPEGDLANLLMVKVMNFNWRRSEVQLES
nr:unnamed protein product [Digitaria exilis]